ncbi:MAG: Mov34/MPN/PAD-1 family protein, partial [Ekhidna sp.]|nr:Mov34/MPN/PAD-1 family protein [Ekhidna sp.]
FVANTLLNSKNAVGLQDNYLKPINEDALYENASGSVAIVDISASQAVARKLSDDEKVTGRRISIFLSPNGSDLVMIAEPADRNIRLNELEAQYYNMVYESDMFLAHFHNPKPQLRYSISCRDISGVMEQDNISALAGIASNAIRRILKETESFIGVWSLEENGSIKVVSQRGEQFESMEINGWTFQVSLGLIEKLKKERHDKLPNETGGVLLGMVDFERKTTYLTGSVKSPSDSDEFPTSYVRGTEGLESKLKLMDQLTNSGIVYIGEWHSHPDNCSLEPSQDDKKLFDWIKDNTSKIGYPPLMVIVGQERIEIYNNME